MLLGVEERKEEFERRLREDFERRYRDERRAADERQEASLQALRNAAAGREVELQDRKSTRLNFSHANISYAVFCLKKKKLISIRSLSSTGVRLREFLHKIPPPRYTSNAVVM